MTTPERKIVDRVFGPTLPNRMRVFLTNGASANGRAFVLPTSALNITTLPAAYASALDGLLLQIPGVSALIPAANSAGSSINPIGLGLQSLSRLSSMINFGFIMNLGQSYTNMLANQNTKNLLVHETAHVWQGQNSVSAMNYVLKSITHQVASDLPGSSRPSAYTYSAGQNFSAYNAEQQAHIIEDWYASGEPTSGPLWGYIQNHVRRGRP